MAKRLVSANKLRNSTNDLVGKSDNPFQTMYGSSFQNPKEVNGGSNGPRRNTQLKASYTPNKKSSVYKKLNSKES